MICLVGPLGAGKTCLTQGIARGLGIGDVSSPSYILISEFEGRLPLFHMDAYRLEGNEEALPDLGLDECFTDASVCVIEWADRIHRWLPREFLEVQLDHIPEGRSLRFHPRGLAYDALVEELMSVAGSWN